MMAAKKLPPPRGADALSDALAARLSGEGGTRVQAAPDGSAVLSVSPQKVTGTPLNKRTEFGDLKEFGERLREQGQLQAAVVARREDYLRLFPEHEAELDEAESRDAEYVLACGERRWRATQEVGILLKVTIDPSLTESRAAFLDAVASENLDRKNLDHIETAQTVEEMVAECGSAVKAAKRFRRHETWVSQYRSLLKLTPEMQKRVRSGDVSFREARAIASKPAGSQADALGEFRRSEAEKDARRRQPSAPPPPPADQPSVPPVPPPAAQGDQGQGHSPAPPDPPFREPAAPPPPAGDTRDQAAPLPPVPPTPASTGVSNPDGAGEPPGLVHVQDHHRAPPSDARAWESPDALAELITARFKPADVRRLVSLLSE